MNPLFGIEVRESRALAGFNRAVRFGDGPIIVSPAMMSLIRNADEAELELLLRSLRVQQLPPMPNTCDLPMTTGDESTLQ